jgi:acyl-CoA thioesterase-1
VAYGAAAAIRKFAAATVLALALPGTALADVTIAALGDSLTQGYGLPQGEGFVPQLQGWLDANGVDATVLNAGVSGDTTAGGLARLDWTLTPEVDALIVALGGNDLLRGLPPEQARSNIDAILARAAEDGLPVLLIGVTAPGNYGPEYKAAFDAIWPDMAAKYGVLMEPSFLAPIEAARDGDGSDAAMRDFMQADGIHPNAAGVARIVAALGPQVARLAARAAP